MPIVEIQSVGEVEFPDEMSPQDIEAAIKRDILPSKTGSFVREAARSVIPAVAGVVSAPFVTGVAAPTGPAAPVFGIAGGIAAAAGTRKAQDALADRFFPDSFLGTKSAQLDASTNPVSSTLGGVIAAGRPSLRNAQSVGNLLTAEGRQLAAQGFKAGATGEAADMARRLTDVGVGGGVNAGISIAQGNNVGQIAQDTALGMVFSKPWIRGQKTNLTDDNRALRQTQYQAERTNPAIQIENGVSDLPIQRGTESAGTAPRQPAGESKDSIPTNVENSYIPRTEEVRSPMRELPQDDTRQQDTVETPPPNTETDVQPNKQYQGKRSSIATPTEWQLRKLADKNAAETQIKIDGKKESNFRQDSLVQFIVDNGGLRSKSAQERIHGGIQKGAGEFDSATRMRDNVIYNPSGGEAPDKMAQLAYDKGLISDPTADSLWRELERTDRSAKKLDTQAADYDAYMAQQEEASTQRLKTKGSAVNVDEMSMGQILFVPKSQGGGRMKVVDIDPDGAVTILMPDKTTQTLPAGAEIMISGLEDGVKNTTSSVDEPF
jgi:hypothetical protein